jgi:hypothetical protein
MRLFTDDMKLFGPRLSASILIAASIVCGRNHAHRGKKSPNTQP